MIRDRRRCLFGVAIAALGALWGQLSTEALAQRNSPAQPNVRQRPEFQPPEVKEGLPNVLILGDSISIGYMLPLRDELAGEANVYRPAANCGPTTRGLENLERWLEGPKWDVIQFNFGLHDLKYMGRGGKGLADPSEPSSMQQVPPEQYAANLHRIAKRLKETGAVIIWRETTPVPEGSAGRVPGDSARYNEVAANVMRELGGIRTDPMFDYASEEPIVGQQLPANVHYTPAGSRSLAKKTAETIREVIPAARRVK